MSNSARSKKTAVLALAKERPEIGKVRAARELRSRGINLTPSAVHAIWKQSGLTTSYERLRLRASHGAVRNAGLSDAQQAQLRRATISRRMTARADGNGDSSTHPRRAELMMVAARIFSAKGYESASLREICAAAGILPGSMYYHFRSKEDLFCTVHAEGFRQLNEEVDRALEGVSDPWDRLEAACAAHIKELVQGNEVLVFTGTSLFDTAGAGIQKRLNHDRRAYDERYRAMIAALALPPDVDRTVFRLSLLGALNWTHVWYKPGKSTPQEIAHQLVSKILHPRTA